MEPKKINHLGTEEQVDPNTIDSEERQETDQKKFKISVKAKRLYFSNDPSDEIEERASRT
ncbi:MAG TPA: hypothetical protein VLH19_05825 [Patescibacteria group bacterium]|nr:hypothetical protein [Patescibacteria group bacterium]